MRRIGSWIFATFVSIVVIFASFIVVLNLLYHIGNAASQISFIKNSFKPEGFWELVFLGALPIPVLGVVFIAGLLFVLFVKEIHKRIYQ